MTETTDRPNTEEVYALAGATSNLGGGMERRGPATLLVAAGITSRDEGPGKRRLGGALQRLLSEWEQVTKPHRMAVDSLRTWIDSLPLVKVSSRTNNQGLKVPVMGRDREGARRARQAQQATSDQLYAQELLQLAQRLPSRVEVRQSLYAEAVRAGFEKPDDLVAGAIVYWLASKCRTCKGTGSVQAGDKVRTCNDCKGTTQAPVPGGWEGHRLVDFMDLCRVTWLGEFKRTYRNYVTAIDQHNR